MRSYSWFAGVATAVGALGGLSSTASAAPDVAAGKAKAVACQACHAAINPNGDVPHLAGQRERYIAKELKAFKTGDRKNDLMSAIANQLSDGDIENLAAFWGSQPVGSDTAEPPEVVPIKRSQMTFPRDFPKGFVLYNTTNKDEENAVSKVFVNTTGLAAVKAGKPLPDGTIIVVVNYAAKLDANKKPVVEKDGSWSIDKITGYAGMEARAGWGKDMPELIRNGDWNYSIFAPDKTARATVNQAQCLTCHKPAAASSYVFGLKDIQAKASK